MAPAEDKQASADDFDFGETVDMNTFSQILEMDDDDDCEFSSSIVFGFFDQAEETFVDIKGALEAKDLDKLSSLGHFLKGSSATLGLTKIKDGCEKIQRYGKRENIDGTPENDEQICLEHIQEAFHDVETAYAEAESKLKRYYELKASA